MMRLKYPGFRGQMFCLIMSCIISMSVYADETENPCTRGPTALLNIVNRPTNADSACVVPFKHFLIEAGYQYQALTSPRGNQQNAPTVMSRLGLPANNELFLLLPNFIHQSISPTSGFSASTLGIKHEFNYSKNGIISGEGLLTPPGGSDAFGSKGLDATVNVIINYSINSQLNLLAMFGGSTMTQPKFNGGKRFQSINPDLVLTYAPLQKINLFGEMYGQTQTGPNQGSGFNSIFGISCLVASTVVIDLEISQRVSGNLGGFDQYIGSGIALMLN